METHPTLGSNTDTGTGSQARERGRDTAGDTGTTSTARERDERESRERHGRRVIRSESQSQRAESESLS